jgi:small-conductance mechanosensitive channel
VALVVLAVIFAGPIVTGDPESVLARAGTVLLLAVALAVTPLLASLALGTVLVFSRRIRIGRQVEVGGQSGRVTAVGLLDVQLRDAEGREVRVPHVLSLIRPSRIEHDDTRIRVELCVSSQVALDQVKELLEGAAASFGDSVKVELREIDADGARYQVSLIARHSKSASDLRLGLSQVLLREGVAWGRQRAGGSLP